LVLAPLGVNHVFLPQNLIDLGDREPNRILPLWAIRVLDDLVTYAIGIDLAAMLMLSATIRNRMASLWLAPRNQNGVKRQAEG
jgi:hypothetical protein